MGIELVSAKYSSESVGEFTPEVGAHESGDFILGVYFGYFNNQTWEFSGSDQGFTMHENGAGDPRPMTCIIWKRALSDNETMPTIRQGIFSASSGSPYLGITRVLSGVVTTGTPLLSSIKTTNEATGEFPTVTTTSADNFVCFDYCLANSYAMVVAPPNVNNHDAGNEAIQGSQELYSTHSWLPHESIGATPSDITVYSDIAGPMTKVTVAVEPQTADGIPVSIDKDNPPTEIINTLGGLTDSYENNSVLGGTYGRDPTSELSQIAGKDITYRVPTLSTDMLSLNGLMRSASVGNTGNNDDNENHGGVLDTANCPDLTGKLVAVRYQISQSAGGVPDLGGLLFGFRDSLGAYKILPLGGKGSLPNTNTPNTGVISVGVSDYDAALSYVSGSPTFDPSDATGLYMGLVKEGATQIKASFSNARVLNPVKLIGDGTADMARFKSAMTGFELETILNQNGGASGQWFMKQPIAATCAVSDANFSVEWLTASGGDNQQGNLEALELGAEWAGDTSITNALFSCATRAYWTTSGSSKTHTWASVTLVNHLITLAAGNTYTGSVSVSASPEIVHNGADLSALTMALSNCASSQYVTITGSTQAELQTALNKWANTEISSSTTYGLNIVYTGVAGDISLSAPSGMDIDKTNYSSTNASALTIVIGASGSTYGTTSTSGSATGFSISNDVTFTVNLSQVGGELTILSTGTQTIQLEVETSSASEVFTFTAPLGVNVDIQYHLPGYLPFWESNRDLGTTASSLTINLDVDPSYA